MSSNRIARFCVCAKTDVHKNKKENTIQIMCFAKRMERPPPNYPSLRSSSRNDVTFQARCQAQRPQDRRGVKSSWIIGIILATIYFVMVYRRFAGNVSASSDEHSY